MKKWAHMTDADKSDKVEDLMSLLGVPPRDRGAFTREFARFEGILNILPSFEQLERATIGSQRLRAMFSDLLRSRQAEPQGDLLSALASVDEGELSWDERTSTCVLLLGAAHITTSTSSVLCRAALNDSSCITSESRSDCRAGSSANTRRLCSSLAVSPSMDVVCSRALILSGMNANITIMIVAIT